MNLQVDFSMIIFVAIVLCVAFFCVAHILGKDHPE